LSKRISAPAEEDLPPEDPVDCAVIGCPNIGAKQYTTEFGITVALCRGHAMVVEDAEKLVRK